MPQFKKKKNLWLWDFSVPYCCPAIRPLFLRDADGLPCLVITFCVITICNYKIFINVTNCNNKVVKHLKMTTGRLEIFATRLSDKGLITLTYKNSLKTYLKNTIGYQSKDSFILGVECFPHKWIPLLGVATFPVSVLIFISIPCLMKKRERKWGRDQEKREGEKEDRSILVYKKCCVEISYINNRE